MLCKGYYFQKKKKKKRKAESVSILCVAKPISVRHPIQSEKNTGLLSLTCRLVLSRTLRIMAVNKSLYRLFICIEKELTDTFF